MAKLNKYDHYLITTDTFLKKRGDYSLGTNQSQVGKTGMSGDSFIIIKLKAAVLICVFIHKRRRDSERRRELLELEEIFTIVLITNLLSLQYHRDASTVIFFLIMLICLCSHF